MDIDQTNIDLTMLSKDVDAEVIAIKGNRQIVSRLGAMGIVPGSIIVKKSASLLKGPIIVAIRTMHLALGYDLAKKVVVCICADHNKDKT